MTTTLDRPAPRSAAAPPVSNRSRPPAGTRLGRLGVSRALLWPALIVAIVLTQVPFVVTIVISFVHWNAQRPSDTRFGGLDNYATVITNGSLISSIGSTVLIVGGAVVLATVLGLLFATLLDRPFRGRALARTLIITPFLIMPAAAALIWKWSMFEASAGIVDYLLRSVGLPGIAWNTDVPVVTVILVLTWQYTPFMMLIILAGLQAQGKDVLEAASVDGAGAWRTFTGITLPHLRQYIEIAVLLGTMQLLQVFDPIAIMTRGTGGTKTLSYLLYERAFVGLQYGEAAAYGVITVIITIIAATIALRTLFKVFSTEGLGR